MQRKFYIPLLSGVAGGAASLRRGTFPSLAKETSEVISQASVHIVLRADAKAEPLS